VSPKVTVVLLHAFPLDERMWAKQVEALDGFDVAAPNLYRLGGGSIEAWAGQLLGQIDGDLVAVGASMGGYCALAMARLAPQRVHGVVLAGSRAGADSPERREVREETIRRLREEGLEGFAVAGMTPAPGVSAEELIRATAALRDRPDATDVVRSFGGLLLLVAGDRDELLSKEEAESIVSAAPNGRLEVFPGAGHFVSVEEPERFTAVLLDFLAPWK
jgi:pimeloyl-ACP methyl ester carboxylesterase